MSLMTDRMTSQMMIMETPQAARATLPAAGVGVGIGWDEIWGGDEMDEAAFGQHGRSKRRIGLLDNSKCNPTPACPAGQMRMSNGECDVPLSSGARQVVGQIAIDTSASNICSMLNGAAWGGVIAGGASFSTSVGERGKNWPGPCARCSRYDPRMGRLCARHRSKGHMRARHALMLCDHVLRGRGE